MIRHLLIAVAICPMLLTVARADSGPVAAFHAEYRVLRNGKAIGRAVLSLRETGRGQWQFSNHTRGTSGLAGLLGVNVTETSTLRWHDGHLQDLHYRYSQNAAIKSRHREIEFDWDAHRAEIRNGRKTLDVALVPGAIDRSLVTVALMADLRASRASPLIYPVVHSRGIQTERYAATGRESLNLPIGQVQALRVERQRNGNKRRTIIWFAPGMNWKPVQIQQVEKHGETITMQLARNH